MNTSIFKTEMGRTIMIQHDVVMPVNIPDFTRDLWKTMKPLGIAEKV